jgi:hypothetical protein
LSGLKTFPQLRWDNGNNSSISFSILGEHARRENVRVVGHELDGTGRLVLRIELPGSKTVQPRAFKR